MLALAILRSLKAAPVLAACLAFPRCAAGLRPAHRQSVVSPACPDCASLVNSAWIAATSAWVLAESRALSSRRPNLSAGCIRAIGDQRKGCGSVFARLRNLVWRPQRHLVPAFSKAAPKATLRSAPSSPACFKRGDSSVTLASRPAICVTGSLLSSSEKAACVPVASFVESVTS